MIVAAVAAALVTSAPPAQSRWFFEPGPAARRAPDARTLVPGMRRNAGKPARQQRFETKARPQEKLPPGPLHIVISIKEQRLTLYANGQPVADSPVSTGVPGHPTPLGVFSILQKNLHHRSNIYSGAPMPYMQRITWSGVAMHEGRLPGYPASHGCIRLPREFAQRLWGISRIGARVIIAQDAVSPADIAHARLFSPKPDLPAMSAAEPASAKIRFATVATLADAPLKGTIDPNENTRIETAIDRAVRAGIAEAEAYGLDAREGAREPEKGTSLASRKDPMLPPGPISIYVSRKSGMLYVRKGFAEVFEAPVTIAQPEAPLGTHVFSALKDGNDGAVRWNVVSLPTERVVKKGKYLETFVRGERLRKELVPPVHEATPPGDPGAALDRVTIPQHALARINELMSPGASLIISDLGLSHETGKGTDFIVLTR
jgi:lipoprotein-anchoring transpeptidase ErfK/SrfK